MYKAGGTPQNIRTSLNFARNPRTQRVILFWALKEKRKKKPRIPKKVEASNAKQKSDAPASAGDGDIPPTPQQQQDYMAPSNRVQAAFPDTSSTSGRTIVTRSMRKRTGTQEEPITLEQ